MKSRSRQREGKEEDKEGKARRSKSVENDKIHKRWIAAELIIFLSQ